MRERERGKEGGIRECGSKGAIERVRERGKDGTRERGRE